MRHVKAQGDSPGGDEFPEIESPEETFSGNILPAITTIGLPCSEGDRREPQPAVADGGEDQRGADFLRYFPAALAEN